MKNIINIKQWVMITVLTVFISSLAMASSHREAPLIANDPLADNVDLYAFKSPDDPNTVTLIATYVPLQLPHGGPNYYNFGENVRYEIHVDNDASVPGDELTYRFTFNIENEDPTTFFNIRLGKQNQKATYTLERSMDGGQTYMTIVENGVVPPNNIGTRSIEGGAGLNTTYEELFQNAITTASTGEKVFAGPTDDPFFVDLGGIFDLGDAPRQNGKNVDGLACYNVHSLAIQVPISTLLKTGAASAPSDILDADYVIGVWASASRPAVKTISKDADPVYEGDWIQVSRLGMPLTNEAVIPIGDKDYWNSITPYEELADTRMDGYFFNPELALYMDDDLFGGAVPSFAPLRVQTNSLGAFDFSNGADGLYGLKGADALAGTALDDAVFGTLLLPGPGLPRSVDLWPAFHTGVPNVIPYQLATGKEGNPLAAGKPFVNNFLPNGGDMLRLNMAVPVTPRDDANFSSLGLIQAAAIGLTVAPFNTTTDLEFIPNMDGFPNGRRLEDDVTRIELQAVSGAVLAAVGLWYDDYDPTTSASPVTDDLLGVLSYTTGVESNDKEFSSSFPYLALPHSGTGDCSGEVINKGQEPVEDFVDQFFVSSNTTGLIGDYRISAEGEITTTTIGSEAMDADGIYYDKARDVLYQLNRTDNVIQAYSNFSSSPTLTATSASLFTNGREIAVSGNRLVVAQDASDSNNGNALLVYNISPNSITIENLYEVEINLWGIHAEGNTLYAIVDNSNQLAVFEDFFDNTSGSINPDQIIDVEGIIRTHGITYDKISDLMILTDVGSGMVADDGAFTVIPDFTTASADDVIGASEQTRVEGMNTLLGNPVDIAYSPSDMKIYVAERANEGGRVLGYDMPTAGGDIAPFYNNLFPGASAIYFVIEQDTVVEVICDVASAVLSLEDGSTAVSVCAGDGESDPIMVNREGGVGESTQWVITDSDGIVLGLPEAQPFDFEGAGEGDCKIYYITYSGELDLNTDDNISDLEGCYAISNSIDVTRLSGADCNPDVGVEGCPTPMDVRIRRSGNGRYSISWDRVAEAQNYLIYVRYKGIPKSQAIVPVRGRRVFISSPSNRILEVEIQTVCGDDLVSNKTETFEIGSDNGMARTRSAIKEDFIVSEEAITVAEFAELYPNPARSILNVVFETGESSATLNVYDLTGKRVISQRLARNGVIHRVDVSSMNDGTYLMGIEDGDGFIRVRQKFVKVSNY